MEIKVLGPGCPKCQEAANVVMEALKASAIPANVEKVTDIKEIMALGVFSTPAVTVDGVVKCSGRVPSKKEILGWIGASV